MKKKPGKVFTYVIASVFTLLILVRLAGLYDNRVELFRKHDVKLLKESVSLADLKIKSKKGKVIEFREFQGKPSLVLFWATWCKFCAKEFPYLAQLNKAVENEGIPVNIITIPEPTDSYSDIKRFYRKVNVSEDDLKPYLSFGEYLHYKLRIRSYPYFLILNEKSQAIATIHPNFKDPEGILDILLNFESLLNAKKAE